MRLMRFLRTIRHVSDDLKMKIADEGDGNMDSICVSQKLSILFGYELDSNFTTLLKMIRNEVDDFDR
jgi:hypothetical protein